MPKYLSGRTKRTPQSALTDERYKYLAVGESEPNLGDPVVPGDSPPFGQQYQIVSVEGYPGERYWIPVGGGIIPGSISVFDEGSLVGGLSSTTQLNFVGNAITAVGNGGANPGIAVTISFTPPGNDTEVIFKESGDFSSSPKLTFDTSNGLLRAGDQIQIGAGGTIITSTINGLVGIGSTLPTQELDIVGDIRLHGTIYDFLNDPGIDGDILVKNSIGGVIWVGQQSLRTGAGGTYTNVQYHNSAGLVDGAPNFVFDDINNRVGIGSTQPVYLLDVLGQTRITGNTQIVGHTTVSGNFYVSGITTITSFLDVNGGAYIDNIRIGIANDNEIDTSIGDLTLDSNSGFTIVDDNLRVSGILTAQGNVDLGSSAANTISLIGDVDTNIIPSTSLTQNLGASDARWNLYVNDIYGNENSSFTLGNLNVLGITTLGSDSSDTLDIKASVRTDIIPSQNYTYDLGSPSFRWDSIYADELYANLFVGIANTALTIKTASSDAATTNYLTFVDSNNTGLAYENVYTSTNIKYVPNTGTLEFNVLNLLGNADIAGNLTVDGDITLGNDINADSVTFNATVDSSIIPGLNATAPSTGYNLGSLSFKWLSVYALDFYGRFIGNADTASKLENSRNIEITGDLSWNVDFDGSVDVTAVGTLANTGVAAGTYGSDVLIPQITVDDKGRITLAANVGVNFSAATVLNSDNVRTASSTSEDNHYVTFVDSNNTSLSYEAVYTDADLQYNPSQNLLISSKVSIGSSLLVNGNSYLGNDISDIIKFNGLIDSNFIPNVNGTYNLGSASFKWNELYINTVNATTFNGTATQADKIKTTAGSDNQPYYLTYVTDANDITGAYEDVYTDSDLYYNPSSNLLEVPNATLSGNLIVNGNTDLGDASTDTVTFNASVDSNIIPSGTRDLGSTSSRWSTVYATTFDGQFRGNADTATRVSAGSTDRNISYYLTFAENNNSNTSRQNEYLYTDAEISYNPNTDTLSITNVSVSGNTDLGDASTDTVTFTASVDSNIIPSGTRDLGSTGNRWSTVYANTFNGQIIGNADTSTRVSTGSTNGNISYFLTFVDSNNGNNNGVRDNEYLYTNLNITYNASSQLLTVPKIKPSVIQDSTNSVGLQNYVLTVVDANGTLEWAPAGTPGGAEAIGGITIENPINTIVGNQLGITTVGFSTNFTATNASTGKVTIDLASDLNINNINIAGDTTIGGPTVNFGPETTVNFGPQTTVNIEGPLYITNIENPPGDPPAQVNGIVPIDGLIVQDNGSQVATGVTIVNFNDNLSVTNNTNGKVTINASGSSSPTQLNVTSLGAVNGTFYPTVVAGSGVQAVYLEGGFYISLSSGTPSLSVTGDITAFASDIRLKTNIEIIDNALEKVNSLSGFIYNFNELGESCGFNPNIRHSGVSAQEVEKVLPEAVAPAPINNDYLTVKYEKIIPLLIEAIKEQSKKIDTLEKKVQSLGG